MNSLQRRESFAPPVYMLHGVFAVQDAHEGYTLFEVQQGVTTALDADSITVTSPDGYVKTYPLGPSRPSELAEIGPGSRVTVLLSPEGLQLIEVGDAPVDGSRTAALVPVTR